MGSFDVVVLGFKLNGPDRPARVLEEVLGLSAADAKALSKSFPAVVRPGVCSEEGEVWATRLRARGARVEVRATPAERKASLPERYVLGTLRILFSRPPPANVAPAVELAPPAPEAEPVRDEPMVIAPEAYGGRMLDDTFAPEVSGLRLSLDHEVLAVPAQQVSGGRPQRPNVAAPRRFERPKRVPWRLWTVVSLAFLAILVGSRELAHGNEPPEEEQELEGDAVPLHPLLAVVPAPMEAPLASILRRQVPGVRNVAVTHAGHALQCMLVGGNASEREGRIRGLLATGTRIPTTPEIDAQLRDHIESLRLAEGDEKARYDALCLGTKSGSAQSMVDARSPRGARNERADEQHGFTGPGRP